jgi:hypothetical protein
LVLEVVKTLDYASHSVVDIPFAVFGVSAYQVFKEVTPVGQAHEVADAARL